MMSTFPFWATPTHEYVVPRSIPIIGAEAGALLVLVLSFDVVAPSTGERKATPAKARHRATRIALHCHFMVAGERLVFLLRAARRGIILVTLAEFGGLAAEVRG